MEEKLLHELSRRRKLLIAAYTVTVAAYLVSILSLLISTTLSLWIVNFTTLFYVLVVRKMDRRYDAAFSKANLSIGTGRKVDTLETMDRSSITCEYLQQRHLIPVRQKGKSVVPGLGVSGNKDQIAFYASELITCYDVLPANGKNKISVLNGVWIETHLPRDVGYHIVLCKKGLLEESVQRDFYIQQGLYEQKIPNSPQNEAYILFADRTSETIKGKFLINCKAICQQAEKQKLLPVIQLNGNSVSVFYNHRNLVWNTPLTSKITRNILEYDRFPELQTILEFSKSVLKM